MASERAQLKALLDAGVLTQAEFDAATSGTANDETLVVAADGSGDFTELGPAIAAAPDGCTIAIKPGLYRCTAIIDKDLSLVASDAGVVVMPETPSTIYEAHKDVIDEYLHFYDEIAQNNKEEQRLRAAYSKTVINVFKIHSISKKLDALNPLENPKIAELHDTSTAAGKAMLETMGQASVFTIRNANVRISGVKFAFPKTEKKSWTEHPQMGQLRRDYMHGVDIQVPRRFAPPSSGMIRSPKTDWCDSGGLVHFTAEEPEHGLEVVDCVFHGGGIAAVGLHAASKHPETPCTIKRCRFDDFFVNRAMRESLEHNLFKDEQAAIYLHWKSPETGEQRAVLELTDINVEKGFSGVNMVSGTHAVMRNCTIQQLAGPGVRIRDVLNHDSWVDIEGCTIKNTEHGSVVGWRTKDDKLNYTAKNCTADNFRAVETKGALEARAARQALEAAKKAAAQREAEKKRRAAEAQAEARRKAAAQRKAAADAVKRKEADQRAHAETLAALAAKRKRAVANVRQQRQTQATSQRREVIPDLPLEHSPSSSSAPSRPTPSPRYTQQTHRCEWCSDPINGQYCYNPKQMLFMHYRKGIFCSRQCQKRAKWNGFEGTKHTVKNGEIVELHFIE